MEEEEATQILRIFSSSTPPTTAPEGGEDHLHHDAATNSTAAAVCKGILPSHVSSNSVASHISRVSSSQSLAKRAEESFDLPAPVAVQVADATLTVAAATAAALAAARSDSIMDSQPTEQGLVSSMRVVLASLPPTLRSVAATAAKMDVGGEPATTESTGGVGPLPILAALKDNSDTSVGLSLQDGGSAVAGTGAVVDAGPPTSVMMHHHGAAFQSQEPPSLSSLLTQGAGASVHHTPVQPHQHVEAIPTKTAGAVVDAGPPTSVTMHPQGATSISQEPPSLASLLTQGASTSIHHTHLQPHQQNAAIPAATAGAVVDAGPPTSVEMHQAASSHPERPMVTALSCPAVQHSIHLSQTILLPRRVSLDRRAKTLAADDVKKKKNKGDVLGQKRRARERERARKMRRQQPNLTQPQEQLNSCSTVHVPLQQNRSAGLTAEMRDRKVKRMTLAQEHEVDQDRAQDIMLEELLVLDTGASQEAGNRRRRQVSRGIAGTLAHFPRHKPDEKGVQQLQRSQAKADSAPAAAPATPSSGKRLVPRDKEDLEALTRHDLKAPSYMSSRTISLRSRPKT